MNLKKYLTLMIVSTIVCWSIFAYVVFLIDPLQTNKIGFTLFYASLFFALNGTFAIAGFLVRFIGLRREMEFYSVKTAFRQSFLFASLLIIVLFLQSKSLLDTTNLVFLVIALSLIEYILLILTRLKIKKCPSGAK